MDDTTYADNDYLCTHSISHSMKILDNTLLDAVTQQARQSDRLRKNYNLHESLEDPVQRMLNAMEPGTQVPVHRHREASETMLLIRGRMKVTLYDGQGNVSQEVVVDPSADVPGIHIDKGEWHGVEVLESSVMLEVKEGPYAPVDPKDILIPARSL